MVQTRASSSTEVRPAATLATPSTHRGVRALGERCALDLLAGRLRGGELLEPLGHFQQLEDADAPAVAVATAAGATTSSRVA
jgi:hypothetical protein